jgi:hypothetical protein
MIFPFIIKYSSPFLNQITEKQYRLIYSEIANHKVDDFDEQPQKIKFNVPLFQDTHNWNLMVPISKGEVRWSANQIYYEISFIRLFIIASLAAIFLTVISGEFFTGLFAFIVLGLFNWIIGVIRHYRFFKKLVSKLNTSYNIT